MSLLPACLALAIGLQQPMPKKPAPKLATGQTFRRALESKLKRAEWKQVGALSMLSDFKKVRKISIVLDRRIDPTQKLDISVTNISLQDLIRQIAGRIKAKSTIVGNVVYIGPPSSVASLPGLVKQRAAELARVSRSLPLPKRLNLTQRRTAHWNDLDTPRDVIKQLGRDLDLKIEGIEQLPHDLLRGATFPKASRSQTLSLLLIQFDLTFRWIDKGAGIAIVPLKPAGKTKTGKTQ